MELEDLGRCGRSSFAARFELGSELGDHRPLAGCGGGFKAFGQSLLDGVERG